MCEYYLLTKISYSTPPVVDVPVGVALLTIDFYIIAGMIFLNAAIVNLQVSVYKVWQRSFVGSFDF